MGTNVTPPAATPVGAHTPPAEDDEGWASEGDSGDDDHRASTAASKAKGKAHAKKPTFTVGGFGWKRGHREHPHGHIHHGKHKSTLKHGMVHEQDEEDGGGSSRDSPAVSAPSSPPPGRVFDDVDEEDTGSRRGRAKELDTTKHQSRMGYPLHRTNTKTLMQRASQSVPSTAAPSRSSSLGPSSSSRPTSGAVTAVGTATPPLSRTNSLLQNPNQGQWANASSNSLPFHTLPFPHTITRPRRWQLALPINAGFFFRY